MISLTSFALIVLIFLVQKSEANGYSDCGCEWCNGGCCCNGGNCGAPGVNGPCPPGLFNGGFVQGPNNGGMPPFPNNPNGPPGPIPVVSNRIPGGDFNGNNGNFPNGQNGFIPQGGFVQPPFQPQMPNLPFQPQTQMPLPNPPQLPFQPQTGLGPSGIPQMPVAPPPRNIIVPQQPMEPIGPLRPQSNRNVNPMIPSHGTTHSNGITATGINYANDPETKDLKHPFERLRKKRLVEHLTKSYWSNPDGLE